MLTLKLSTVLIDFVTKVLSFIERITQARGGKWPGSLAWAAVLIVAFLGVGATVALLVGPEASANVLTDATSRGGGSFGISVRFGPETNSTEPTPRVPNTTPGPTPARPERKDCPRLNLSHHAPKWPYCGEQTYVESQGICTLPEGVGDQPGIDLAIEMDAYCADLNSRFLRRNRAKETPQ
ncbi:hypothetical protein WME94_34290 [Sorangium sp. So ce429]